MSKRPKKWNNNNYYEAKSKKQNDDASSFNNLSGAESTVLIMHPHMYDALVSILEVNNNLILIG